MGSTYFETELEQAGRLQIFNTPRFKDSNVLVTISNEEVTETYLITPTQFVKSDAKYFIDAPPERAAPPNLQRKRRIGKSITVLGYAATVLMLTFAGLSATGYVKARIVLTGSMLPDIAPGDIIVTGSPDRVAPEVGKVITYQARRFDGSPVGIFSHRIIGSNAQDGWLVKGDNNPSPDVQQPKGADVLGVLIFTVPFLGRILSKQFLFTAIPIIIGIWFLIDVLKGVSRD